MFNLLRRRSKKSKKLKTTDAANNSADELCMPEATTPAKTTGVIQQRYRQFSEFESESVLPTAIRTAPIRTKRKYTRAAIEEFEDDLLDLRGVHASQNEIGNTTAESIGRIRTRADCASAGSANLSEHSKNRIYFISSSGGGGFAEQPQSVSEKVNLAKTAAAANFTPNVTSSSSSSLTSSAQIDATVRNYAHNRFHTKDSDSAVQQQQVEAFEISKYNDDEQQQQQQQLAAATSNASERHGKRTADAFSTGSQNEQAEWQGHVSTTFGKRKIIDKFIKRNEKPSLLISKQINNINNTTTASVISIAENAEGNRLAIAQSGDKNNTTAPANSDSRSRSDTADTVINEVKYRNLGNSQTVKRNSEAKRQSRLSLTLGLNLNLTNNNAKSEPNKTSKTEEVSSSGAGKAVRRSFFSQKLKNIVNDQTAATEVGAHDNHEADKRPNSKLFFTESAQVEKLSAEVDRKRRPLQKSKEFLSDIFMARGRNHNRHRNQNQNQSQNLNKQPQQQSVTVESQAAAANDYKTVCNNHTNNCNLQMDPAAIYITSNNNNNNNYDRSNSATNMLPHSTHLETISDPSSVSTNSYQMTTSNNSNKNFSQFEWDEQKRQPKQQQQQQQQARSNSAEPIVSGDPLTRNNRQHSRARSLSEEKSVEHCKAGASRATRVNQEESPELAGKRFHDDVQRFIHAANIERNGVQTANATFNNAQTARAQQQNKRAVDENRNKTSERETIITTDCDAYREAVDKNCQFNGVITACECDHEQPLEQEYDASDFPLLAQLTSPLYGAASMGQANAKVETPTSTRASTPREFRESVEPEVQNDSVGVHCDDDPATVIVPAITVVDYSAECAAIGGTSTEHGPVEQEVFYDFENEAQNAEPEGGLNITVVDETDENIDDGFIDDNYAQQIPLTVHQNKWSHMNMHRKLENVQEEDEEEDDDENEDDGDGDEENEQRENAHGGMHERNLDNELHGNQFDSPERHASKSSNNSDSNLSTSFPDSGIGGDSQLSSPISKHAPTGDNDTTAFMRSAASHQQQQQQRIPFVRDGNSTDCDESLMQCDDLDYLADDDAAVSLAAAAAAAAAATSPLLNERLVCIESISLPDVVVESTNGALCANGAASTSAAAAATAAAAGEQIININGATGNSMGNVHFIPIHVEGVKEGSPKRRSLDDSVIGSGGKHTFGLMNGHHTKPTIEIIEESSESNFGYSNESKAHQIAAEKLKHELNEQKTHYDAKLDNAQKNLQNLQNKVYEMQTKIQNLEKELSTKAWNVERLQGELAAAHKDDEFVRQKLKLLEDEKTNLRHKYTENEDEFKRKFEELETQYNELEEKYRQTQRLASNLQTQLATAQSEAEEWRQEVDKIRIELEEQIRILKSSLENSEAERKICQDKWQKEFEMLRTQNQDREETLMNDCEWQLRQMQKQSKDKIDKVRFECKQTAEKAEKLEQELVERDKEVENLKGYQAEVRSLRGVVREQELSIQTLMKQIETLKSDLQTANEHLEEQVKAVKRIKYLCDNALCDKEREMVNRIDEIRNEAAAFWENKLYSEMTRLKTELESVYVDERREALDKLQTEHIEELRALTTRYTANEEELRVELAEVQERLDQKSEEFIELREKSDSTLLQTRMHLDRADRDYQRAMSREEERREALEKSLRDEFEVEKEEMEEKFRERLGQVKEEFARELQTSTQEMRAQHRKTLEQQKAKLQAERDEALQELSERHRKKMAIVEEQMKEIKLQHQHDLKDLKAAYDTEKAALDKRDISNANEIEQLHRKCRCLTNLFEEMRMRYERRDPRPEDLREIAELRSRCESQESDLYLLTDRLRNMQIQLEEAQQTGTSAKKPIKKPPPKTIPTSCDVIYEENEERESPPPSITAQTPTLTPTPTKNKNQIAVVDENEEDDEKADEDEEEEESEEEEEDTEEVVDDNEDAKKSELSLNSKNTSKNLQLINDDESHMITAM